MADDSGQAGLLSTDRARALSQPQISRPYWGARTPRWICSVFKAIGDGCLPIRGGALRVNYVDEPFLDIQSATGGVLNLPSSDIAVAHSHAEGTGLSHSHAEYGEPREVALEPIQTVVKLHKRVGTLYSDQHDQRQQQLQLAAEYMKETKENLIFNHPTYGLVNNIAEAYHIHPGGPPTPDVLDDILSRGWKGADVFAMHPEVLEVFHRELSNRGLASESVQMFGATFSAWRGLPIIPTNKLQLHGKSRKLKENEVQERERGKSESEVLLLRVGEAKQGVVSLFAEGSGTGGPLPGIEMEQMYTDDQSVESYLLTLYSAMAVLTASALVGARVVV